MYDTSAEMSNEILARAKKYLKDSMNGKDHQIEAKDVVRPMSNSDTYETYKLSQFE